MPRVTQRKARKDYPESGIKKGDLYYYTSLKLQRGGIVKRSLTPFKPSQLTNSPFKSGWYSTQEAWDTGDKDSGAMQETAEAFREIANEAREIANEARESFDNMPEGLQQGDTGQLLENRSEEGVRIADELDELATEMENLTVPTEPSETFDPSERAEELSTMEPDDAAEYLSDREQEHTEALSDYQGEVDEYESEQERIKAEADDLAGGDA